jgi:rare lipoprotein A
MVKKLISVFIIVILIVSACSNAPRYRGSGPRPKAKSLSTKTVKHQKMMTGVSSYYAEDFHGKLTANGEVYDMHGLTAAHKTLPLNTIVRVTNVDNNKSLILRINDRGPYVKGRILDCSYGAALKLGFVGKGTTKVKIEVIEFGDNKYMKHKKS